MEINPDVLDEKEKMFALEQSSSAAGPFVDNNDDGDQTLTPPPAKRPRTETDQVRDGEDTPNEQKDAKPANHTLAACDFIEKSLEDNVKLPLVEKMVENQSDETGVSHAPHKANNDKSKHLTPANDDIHNKLPEEICLNRKKKVALLLSYCGAGYFGMQKNPNVITIEDELLDALGKVGAIKYELKDDLGKLSFQRCARTDKGVSASRQVVSLKMVPSKDLIPLINVQLPPSIRVFGMVRVTKGFDSKNQCNARTYQYLTPSFAFAPTEMLTVSSYRLKPPEIERVNSILKILCGTHNFHNFTSGRSADEASAQRYIMDFKAEHPFVKKGHEFIVLSVKGQSFMLHQIRKMIGLSIAICRGFCGEDVIDKSWGKNKIDIPKAPGLGLILDVVHFDRYNQRYGSDGMHEAISWDDNRTEIEEFKNSFIWDTIVESEITQKSMMKWLGTLKNHTYSDNRIPGNNYAKRDNE